MCGGSGRGGGHPEGIPLSPTALADAPASELQTEPTNVSCCSTVYSLGRATLEPQCLLLHDKVMAVS